MDVPHGDHLLMAELVHGVQNGRQRVDSVGGVQVLVLLRVGVPAGRVDLAGLPHRRYRTLAGVVHTHHQHTRLPQ